MMSSYKTFIRQGDNLYEVIDTFSIDYFYDNEKLLKKELFDGWKEQLKADIALKNGARFYFCKNIEEAEEVVEESMVEKVD
jgi:hypothetical protein